MDLLQFIPLHISHITHSDDNLFDHFISFNIFLPCNFEIYLISNTKALISEVVYGLRYLEMSGIKLLVWI